MNLRRFNTEATRVKLLTYSFTSLLCGIIWAVGSLLTNEPLVTYAAYLFFTLAFVLFSLVVFLIVWFSDKPQGKQ